MSSLIHTKEPMVTAFDIACMESFPRRRLRENARPDRVIVSHASRVNNIIASLGVCDVSELKGTGTLSIWYAA